MSSIDERVVEMKFNNAQFEAGVKSTNQSLSNLKKGLDLSGATKGLDGLQAAGNRFSLSHLADGVQGISAKFSALQAVAFGVFANIGAQAASAGVNLVKSLTVDPIASGFKEYNLQMGSIQTILANTARYGTKLPEVTKNLNELNAYADKTIYSFSDMTRNIGLFTNSGLKVGDATSIIKGFSNEAAASGTSAEGAAGAAYQLSQALNSGTIRLMDFRSLTNVGLGNKNMQNGLVEIAGAMGTLKKANVTGAGVQKNFNASLEKGWLSAGVMSTYLKIMAGDYSEAQQKTLGLSDAQIKAFAIQQKNAEDAATKVRTLPQLIGTLQEAVGSSYGQTFSILFGNFNQATKLFTDLNNTISPIILSMGNARNKLLQEFNSLGGRSIAIDAISNVFKAIENLVKPIHDAFRDIFPPTTAAQLIAITKAVETFTENLKNSTAQVAPQVKRTFAGVFAVFDIGRMILVGIITTIGQVFGAFSGGTGSILDITASIGDFLVGLRNAIKAGSGLQAFFSGLGAVLSVPITLIRAFIGTLVNLVSGVKNVSGSGLGKTFTDIGDKLQPLNVALAILGALWSRFLGAFGRIFTEAAPAIAKIGELFSQVGQKIVDGLANQDYSQVLDTINVGLFGGLILLIKKFFSNGFSVDIGGGLLGSIKDTFEGLTGVLSAMQQNIKANVILKIAIALALLTASVVALSMIDSGKLTAAITAMTVMFSQLGAAMFLFGKISVGPGLAKMPVLTASMILLAIAIDILANAVRKLASLDLAGLAKGLGGVTFLLVTLAATAKYMVGSSKGLITAGLGMIAIAFAISILANAVAKLGSLDIGTLAKGLGGVAVALATVAGFSRIISPKGMITAGLSLIILGAGLNIMAKAVAAFGAMSIGSLASGLTAMGLALVIVAGALHLMPGPEAVVSAAALIIVAEAMVILASALTVLGGMSLDAIGKSLGVMAAALIILAGSLILMTEALPGAAALLVAAYALVVLAPALLALGSMDIDTIGKALGVLAASLIIIAASMILMTEALPGAAALLVVAAALTILAPALLALGSIDIPTIIVALVTMAAAFAIIGIAGLLLAPLIPALLGLGLAITLLGVGVGAAGAGVFLFAAGLTALGAAGAAGAAGLTIVFSAILGLIPLALTKLGQGIVALAGVIAKGAPAIVGALVAVLKSLISAITTLAPLIVNALVKLVLLLVNTLVNNVPKLVAAGLKLLTGIYNGIANNLGKLITAATSVVVAFINGISANLPRVVNAGINLIIHFVNSLASSISTHAPEMRSAGLRLALAIIDGMTGGLASGIGRVIGAAVNVAASALNAAKNALGIHSPSKEFYALGKYSTQGFANGLKAGTKAEVQSALSGLTTKLKDTLLSTQNDIDAAQKRLATLNSAKKKNTAAISDAKKTLARAKKEHAETQAAYTALTKTMKTQETTLTSLASKNETLTTKVKDATTALTDATKARDDYNKSIKDQYDTLETIGSGTHLSDFEASTKKQIDDTLAYTDKLASLRKLGLSDKVYTQLLQSGTAASPLVTELLSQGKAGVDTLNKLGAQLDTAASTLGTQASTQLYQAAVDSAQGIVDGLKAQQGAIEKQMETIADAMVKAIKKKLDIHSPSKEFAKVGAFSVDGLRIGLENSTPLVEKAASNVGETAIYHLKKSIAGISSAVATDMDFNPTIRPVLDLTGVQKDANTLNSLLTTAPLTLSGSISLAKTANAGYQANVDQNGSTTANSATSTTGTGSVTYNQYNNSPKALSAGEIYRQTKNQLSVAKGAVNN